VLEALGPAVGGVRTVVAVYATGQVMVPFASYEGMNSGVPIYELSTSAFRESADKLFGFRGTERIARTGAGWLTPGRTPLLLEFCRSVADAYRKHLDFPVVMAVPRETASSAVEPGQ